MENFRSTLVSNLSKLLAGYTSVAIDQLLEQANVKIDADFALPCHLMAAEQKRPPKCIAADLADKIRNEPDLLESCSVDNVTSLGNYVNFRVNRERLVASTIETILSDPAGYGSSNVGKGQRVVLDYSGPNIGKPLHIGHIRSTILGDSIARILKFSGFETYGINYTGDMGLHIGKILAAYELWGSDAALDENPEKEMFDLYVRFGKEAEHNPKLEQKAKAIVREIEEKNPAYISMLQKINHWSATAMDRVYGLLDINFDETTGQSRFSAIGKALVASALEKGIARFDKDESMMVSMEEGIGHKGVVIPLEQYGLPNKMVLREDGTAIYSTQDLGAAVDRFQKHNFDRMIYVVANEQATYFRQIFKILDIMGFGWSKDCHHLSFGMIRFKEGEMSSREGNVVLLEDVLQQATQQAESRIKNSEEPDKTRIATQVGVGAMKYMILSVDPTKGLEFSWERAMDFSSNSGPYVQYTHARLCSILSKAGPRDEGYFNTASLLGKEEIALVRQLADFPSVVERAATTLKPNLIANYANELSQRANEFYHNQRILGSEEEASRLVLADATRKVLTAALGLLGISAPERM